MADGDTDYAKAASYCASILKNCPAALNFTFLRIEYLLRSNQLKEAESCSEEAFNQYSTNPKVMAMHGRVMIYNGKEIQGKKLLQKCLEFDPDNKEAARAIKAIKISTQKKDEASEAFKQGKLDQAIVLFDECVNLDPINLVFNATILLNKAIALGK